MFDEIRKDYERTMSAYPLKKKEVDEFLSTITDTGLASYLQYLYAFMPAQDIASYSVSDIFCFAKGAKQVKETLSYTETIPWEIFYAYVLFYRINNENIDGHREIFYQELYPRIQNLSMKEAILEVNYWCYEKATYIPTDGRTISPLGMIKAAKGRCGEESTLAVAALRSVGIPARQCYVPRWAHCDDNHAWVEVWADGEWYYLGACEPEPVLNKGWFTAAASKSMLVHSKAFSRFIKEEGNQQETPLYELVNSTRNYGSCKKIEVTVTEEGKTLAHIPVSFELVNYGELFPLYRGTTDEHGKAYFVTGYGDIHIYVQKDSRILTYKMDVRKESEILLDFQDSMDVNSLECIVEHSFDMVPPSERVDQSLHPSPEVWEHHKERLRQCEKLRSAYESTFVQAGEDEKGSETCYKMLAKGNHAEIEAFLQDTSFEMADKLTMLETLREKDFIDITSEVLKDYLSESLLYKQCYSDDTFRNYILPPRVENEMITANRGKIRRMLENRLQSPPEIWNYLQTEVLDMKMQGFENLPADSYGCLYYGICEKYNKPILFVAICRALGIPARLNPVTRYPEYGKEDGGVLTFYSVEESGKEDSTPVPYVSLHIKNISGKELRYHTQLTIAKFENGTYETQQFEDMILGAEAAISLLPGSYRILTVSRQIDGAALTKCYYFHTDFVKEIVITLAEDKTAEKLKYESIPDTEFKTAEGKTTLFSELGKEYGILIFAEPGKEPTEHLLQELLEHKEAYKNLDCPVLLVLPSEEGMENPTFKRVLSEIDRAKCLLYNDSEYLYNLHCIMKVGDERLPFALVTAPSLKGLFAFANYNIGTAETMLSIIKIHAKK